MRHSADTQWSRGPLDDIMSMNAAINVLLEKRPDIHERVLKHISSALSLEIDVIRANENASILIDHGIESLEFVLLLIRLEREFGVQINTRLLSDAVRAYAGGLPDDNDEIGTSGAGILKELMPELSSEHVTPQLRYGDIESLYCVKSLVRLVAWGVLQAESR